MLSWNIFFGILTLRKRQKAQMALKFQEVATHISPKSTSLNFTMHVSNEIYLLVQRFSTEIFLVCSLVSGIWQIGQVKKVAKSTEKTGV